MQIDKRDAVLAAGALLLLAVAIVRTAVPDRSRIRPLGVQGFDIPSERIERGQELVRSATWTAPADVYVLGWSFQLGSPAARGELTLQHGNTRLFFVKGESGAASVSPAFFTNGAAYRLLKNEVLEVRYRVMNSGDPGDTMGASALVYFVPVEGN